MIALRHTMPHIFILLGMVRYLSADAHPSPLDTMADVTNDFGVCVLQIIASPNVNTVFSPYGLMSMALLVYEGTRGQAAAEIYNTLHLPWHRDIVRIGFRDLHRYLRSYFSSEGFLKGLVLSKPNVTLRNSYIKVLKFYGFQSDTSITQPVFTTQASVGNREKSNETVTNIPETTAPDLTTPVTTMIPKTTKPEENETIVPTTLASTTEILMGTGKPPTQPDILSMRGPEDEKTTVPATTIPTTVVTTTRETTEAKPEESPATTLQPTKEAATITTIKEESTTKDAQTSFDDVPSTTASDKETSATQETETESSMPEVNVVTMINVPASELESMNMMMDTANDTDPSDGSSDSPETETEKDGGKTTISDFVTISNEISTKEIFTEVTKTETVTLFVDTTLPIEEVTLLTTPVSEVFTDKNTPMLEAVILMEESAPDLQKIQFTTDSTLNKRATDSNPVLNDLPKPNITTNLNTMYSILHKNSTTESKNQYNVENQSWSIMDNKDQMMVESILSNLIDSDVNGSYHNLENNGTETLTDSNDVESSDDNADEVVGFPTLEPDTIIFPSVTQSRPRRSVQYDNPQSASLGNWVGSSGWYPSPTDQWFWTFTGDKLVPVLTYTAFMPYVDLPALRATALQLPLDDVRYSLVILLPKQARGLKQLLYSLQWCPLRSIMKQFKQTPVYAVVPTFTIVKHINLTPALHKLGVRKIFDGFMANLCEMSDEPNLYVRSVEQVITISVQKYFTNQNSIGASPVQVEQHFLATHPFVYFVVDLETKVALVAGTVVDPTDRNS
ncbi:uncharacterized protein LOC128992023 [Macrosteles quadrilineatus]|uniref:uncharacterized protein LOC128992023 n=1 Tax=Macrosteles quadrilineatus TaxID=74068 RepID=UPI0023E0CC78|nr:uncharacterized protein LOC128992023 [Macrosteles quadrilineatus]XP_054271342.1 uncharacterized protein LOC128992023 [Macrosteles quadrilineatus]